MTIDDVMTAAFRTRSIAAVICRPYKCSSAPSSKTEPSVGIANSFWFFWRRQAFQKRIKIVLLAFSFGYERIREPARLGGRVHRCRCRGRRRKLRGLSYGAGSETGISKRTVTGIGSETGIGSKTVLAETVRASSEWTPTETCSRTRRRNRRGRTDPRRAPNKLIRWSSGRRERERARLLRPPWWRLFCCRGRSRSHIRRCCCSSFRTGFN